MLTIGWCFLFMNEVGAMCHCSKIKREGESKEEGEVGFLFFLGD